MRALPPDDVADLVQALPRKSGIPCLRCTIWWQSLCRRETRAMGIVTIGDIVHIVEEEATEDIQKLGGMEPCMGLTWK